MVHFPCCEDAAWDSDWDWDWVMTFVGLGVCKALFSRVQVGIGTELVGCLWIPLQ